MTLGSLSDPQAKEIVTLFQLFDTDKDGYITPQSACKLCQELGYNLDQSTLASTTRPLNLHDVLSWCDTFCGQCLRSDDLRLTQRFSLLRGCDAFATGARITRDALLKFLEEEGHAVNADVVDQLLHEIGTEGELSKEDFGNLLGTNTKSPKQRRSLAR